MGKLQRLLNLHEGIELLDLEVIGLLDDRSEERRKIERIGDADERG